MIDIDEHCFLLHDALSGIGGFSHELLSVTDHLRFASGIVDVELNLKRFERPMMMCSRGEAYLAEKDDVLRHLARRLTTFNLVWSALECYANILDEAITLPEVKEYRGKINSLCKYLTDRATGLPVPPEYRLALDELLSLIPDSHATSRAKHRRTIPDFVSEHGRGVYHVYPLRNAFAHGDLITPEPEDGGVEGHPDILLIERATRLILFTIQFLTLATFDHAESVALANFGRWEDEEDPLTVSAVFNQIHAGSEQFAPLD